MSTSDPRGPVRAPTRPSAGRVVGLIALIWGVGVAFTLTVASDTRIGPVVYKFTRTHGVHLGDVYATLGVAAVATLLTVWVVMDHSGRKRRYQRYLRRHAAEPAPEPVVDPDEQQTMIVEPAYAYADEPDDEPFDYYDDGPYDDGPYDDGAGRYDDVHSPEAVTQKLPRGRHARFDD